MKKESAGRKARRNQIYEDIKDQELTDKYTPFLDTLNLEEDVGRWKLIRNLTLIFCFRYLVQLTGVHVQYHPDENWQALEIAYDLLYGKRSATASDSTVPVVEMILSWEWISTYSLRNHLYPFFLALPGFLLKFLGLDYNFLLVNSMYAIHSVIWTYGDYFLYYLARAFGGKQLAVISLAMSLTHEFVIKYLSHTSMNGIECQLAVAALYYYLYLRPEIGCKNLSKMTVLITINFLARSSSLAPWIPLSIFKIAENTDFFIPIVVAGLTITIPLCVASTLLDSYYYGALTIPQYNFVNVNVLENLSIFFGIDPWYTYLYNLQYEFGCIYWLSIFGFCLLSYKQMHGTLYHHNREMREQGFQRSYIPSLFIYTVSVITTLSIVDHKELRFQAPVIQLGCIFQSYAFIQLYQIVKMFQRRKLKFMEQVSGMLLKYLTVALTLYQAKKSVVCYLFYFNQLNTMLDPYHIFNGNSPHLYIDGNMSNPESFRRAESIYFLEKFEQPIHLLLHKPTWDTHGTQDWVDGKLQTTALYQPFRYPIFVNQKMPNIYGMKNPSKPNLTFPSINAQWINHEEQLYPVIELFYQMESEQVFPEYIWGHHSASTMNLQYFTEDHIFKKFLKKIEKFYNVVDSFHGMNQVFNPNNVYRMYSNPRIYLLKLKDEYRPRMIRAGYSYDPTGFNSISLGSLTDMNRAFIGLESPYKEQMKEKMQKKKEKDQQKKENIKMKMKKRRESAPNKT